MQLEIKQGDKFRHFKGTVYQVIALAKHTESEETLVVYKDADGNAWARPIEMFCSLVDTEKYPDVKQKYRFEKI
ncbi:MAG: DUF1653 domain-containing protein [Ruminococcaceae bacterium]|nr:DUF1653 domain-containing protein [Oscillospiraceae bacterium]